MFRDVDILEWISSHLQLTARDLVLDVAGGTGQLGRHLAKTAAFAIVVDLTPEMLREGVEAARRASCGNVVFVEGDATRLPFPDAQFDLVASRFALHHLDDGALAAREMARVCRPGGTVAIIDMVSEPGAAGLRHNELERLRDPSHARAPTEEGLIAILVEAGADAEIRSVRRQQMPVEPWLDQAKPGEGERQAVIALLRAEIDGGPPSGMRATLDDEGGLLVEQRWLIAAGPRS